MAGTALSKEKLGRTSSPTLHDQERSLRAAKDDWAWYDAEASENVPVFDSLRAETASCCTHNSSLDCCSARSPRKRRRKKNRRQACERQRCCSFPKRFSRTRMSMVLATGTKRPYEHIAQTSLDKCCLPRRTTGASRRAKQNLRGASVRLNRCD